ncbi:MAG: M4 family metallopeptidase [Myxococcales bacterium]|nr:M4 family metallopeptidase [Myxococcales bacterium]
MSRSVFVLAFLAACSSSGLDAPTPVFAENLFPSGSAEEETLAEAIAYEHLEASERLVGVGELWTEKVHIDALSTAHVKITQSVGGVPVFGGESIVHVKPNGVVSAVSDSLVRDIAVTDALANYTDEESIEAAVELTGGWADVTNMPHAKLLVVRHEGEDHLAWAVSIERMDGTERSTMPMVFMDAKYGDMLFQLEELQAIGSADTPYNGPITFQVESSGGRWALEGSGYGSGWATYSYQNATRATGASFDKNQMIPITSPTQAFTDDAAAVDAHWATERTFAFLDQTHDWQGFNGSGGPRFKSNNMTVVVHYGQSYNNAFWNGQQITFGDGDGTARGAWTSLDVVAHEIGHAVTKFSANLTYQGESGALNEAFSDILGVRVEAWVHGGIDEDTWKIAEDVVTPNGSTTDALRYMYNPTLSSSSRDHYSTRYTGTADSGGVHWNSGIANLAFYLTAEGGNHPKPAKSVTTVEGIGLVKAGQVYWRALHNYMTSSTDFAGARAATLHAAADLYGAGSVEYAAVGNAWAEVGVGQPIDVPAPPSPPPTGDGNATNLSAEKDAWHHFTVQVPNGATELNVQIQGDTGDADLYVRQGSAPTTTEYDCRPFRSGNEESCTLENPAAGPLHVMVRGYREFSGVALLGEAE